MIVSITSTPGKTLPLRHSQYTEISPGIQDGEMAFVICAFPQARWLFVGVHLGVICVHNVRVGDDGFAVVVYTLFILAGLKK